MENNENKDFRSAYEFATDSCGWNITKGDSAELFKLWTQELGISTDKSKNLITVK